MKSIRYLLLIGFTLCLVACGGSGGDVPGQSGEKPSGGKEVNVNANDMSVHPEYGRLEVPRLKGGSSRVIIHYTRINGSQDVNFMTEWDDSKRSQRWSCYILDRTTVAKNVSRWRAGEGETQYPHDPQIPNQYQLQGDPYYGSGYDHGHICPSNDRVFSREANVQTFYLSNMQPQFSVFNAGVWANMEIRVNTLPTQNNYQWCDKLYICKGGTIDDGQYEGYNKVYRTAAQNKGLLVPRYFYMALLREKNGQYNAIALWIDQYQYRNSDEPVSAKFAISIDELEERTGIDFFCNLPDEVENRIEKECTPAIWGLR